MLTITAPELRADGEGQPRFATTRTGLQIGVAYVRPPSAADAESISGPHHKEAYWRRADRAVLFTCALAAAFLAGLLLAERIA